MIARNHLFGLGFSEAFHIKQSEFAYCLLRCILGVFFFIFWLTNRRHIFGLERRAIKTLLSQFYIKSQTLVSYVNVFGSCQRRDGISQIPRRKNIYIKFKIIPFVSILLLFQKPAAADFD